MSQRNARKFFEDFAQALASFAFRKNLFIKLIILFSISSDLAFGQEIKLSEVIINIAEDLADSETDPEAVSTYIEKLFDLAENPVKLNLSDENEISRLFFLSDFQVKVLADYVYSSGKIISIYELANIPGFDKETVEMILPFISLDVVVNMNHENLWPKNTLLTNLSIKPGIIDSTSLGSPWKLLSKYKFIAGNFSGGFTGEKDPGERFFSDKPPIPDFLSAHFAYTGTGMFRKLILGDYSARFGQGTAINTTIRTALSLTAQGYMSARDEIKPYTSSDENNFFRGIAAEFALKKFGLYLFYSRNYSDATLTSSSDSSDIHINNFYKTGIHNTNQLLQKKDAISETVTGANLTYNLDKIKIGLIWMNNRFSLPVKQVRNIPENVFDFNGDNSNICSFYYNSLVKRTLFYAEFSLKENGKHAFVQGFSFRPSDRLTINFLYRDYDAGYISFHGKGPGNNSVTGNEHGVLANFTFEAAKHLFISGGGDIFYFPWLKFRCSSPSMGKRQEIRIKYLPSDALIIDASFRKRLSMVDNSNAQGIPELNLITSNAFKISVRYSPMEAITFTTRVDYKIISSSGNTGMLLLQDFNYRFNSIPLSLWGRYCIFNTDDWESRLYTYENDLLYSFNIPALSGKGSRSYIMVKWEFGYFVEIRVKYGLTSLTGSVRPPVYKDEAKLQLKLRF